MTGPTRIVAIESGEPEGPLAAEIAEPVAEAPVEAEAEVWEEAPARPARSWLAITAGLLTVIAVTG